MLSKNLEILLDLVYSYTYAITNFSFFATVGPIDIKDWREMSISSSYCATLSFVQKMTWSKCFPIIN